MLASVHVLAGFVSATLVARVQHKVVRTAAAFVLGVASHMALDAIPHSDYGTLSNTAKLAIVVLEIGGSLALGAYILRPYWRRGDLIPLLAGLFGATVPDAKFPALILPERAARWVETVGNDFHRGFHADLTTVRVGLTYEIICLFALLYALTVVVRRVSRAGTS